MERISIRDLRGKALLDRARKGEPLAITEYRVLIGVIIPAAEAWAQHLICQNWERVQDDIAEAEQAMAAGSAMTTLEAAIVNDGVAETPQSKEAIRQLHAAWNLPGSVGDGTDDPSPVHAIRPVRIGDLSATLIKEAGRGRQALAVTHDRELVGILVPVTQDLVQFLIEQNMSRVLGNIEQADELLESGDPMVTLDAEIPPRTAG
jgi:antitoxin (DNA-binding transcriptional repressor) of toxin-antitoxin stability system